MATFRSFEEIDAWKKARELTRCVYVVSSRGSFSRDFALRDQIRRAVISIASNIAEGYERDGRAEFLQFLSIAKGSIGEVKTQLYLARDLEYLDEVTAVELMKRANELGRMVAGLINYLRSSRLKGIKYR